MKSTQHVVAALGVFLVAVGALAQSAAASRDVSVLTGADAERYERIFELQKNGRWKEADALIAKLSDRVLMGHVLHQRYMHPTAYRSSFAELKKWMAYYADHPQAGEIYRLAMRRRPKRAGAPVRPKPRQWRTAPSYEIHPDLQADYDRTSGPGLRQIEGRVRYLTRREQAVRARREIDAKLKQRRITTRQYDRMRSWIAASLYYQGYVEGAERMANSVAARNGETAVLAYWISGLIDFRQGDLKGAHGHFDKMAAVPYQDDDLRAAAGFWAARTALAAGAVDRVASNLEIAAARPFTFYGQLALAQLGREHAYNWTTPEISKGRFAEIARDYPAVRRAAALVEAGRSESAAVELRWANGAIEDGEARDLLAVATALDLPAAQMEIAAASPGEGLEAGLYPVPDYSPRNGFQTDRAIVYALVRQESKFRPDATSRAGARGLMQLMPRTASHVAKDRSLQRGRGRAKLYDPALNLQIGQSYVKELISTYTDGDLFKTAIAYNGGPGNLRRWDRKLGIDDPLLFIESIPNPESRDYVEKVLTNVWVYRARLGQPAPTRDKVASGELPVYEAVDQLTASRDVR